MQDTRHYLVAHRQVLIDTLAVNRKKLAKDCQLTVLVTFYQPVMFKALSSDLEKSGPNIMEKVLISCLSDIPGTPKRVPLFDLM